MQKLIYGKKFTDSNNLVVNISVNVVVLIQCNVCDQTVKHNVHFPIESFHAGSSCWSRVFCIFVLAVLRVNCCRN